MCPAPADAKACPLYLTILQTLPQIAVYYAYYRSDLVFLVVGPSVQLLSLPEEAISKAFYPSQYQPRHDWGVLDQW